MSRGNHNTDLLKRLRSRREMLRGKLSRHFAAPPNERDYRKFERIVDELDRLNGRITPFNLQRR